MQRCTLYKDAISALLQLWYDAYLKIFFVVIKVLQNDNRNLNINFGPFLNEIVKVKG